MGETCRDELPAWPEAVRVINQQLWCCRGRDAGIVVVDSELQPQRRIWPGDDIKHVRDVAQTSNGDVIIAASNGLFHISDGEC